MKFDEKERLLDIVHNKCTEVIRNYLYVKTSQSDTINRIRSDPECTIVRKEMGIDFHNNALEKIISDANTLLFDQKSDILLAKVLANYGYEEAFQKEYERLEIEKEKDDFKTCRDKIIAHCDVTSVTYNDENIPHHNGKPIIHPFVRNVVDLIFFSTHLIIQAKVTIRTQRAEAKRGKSNGAPKKIKLINPLPNDLEEYINKNIKEATCALRDLLGA